MIGKVNKLFDPCIKDRILKKVDEFSILKEYIDIDIIPCLIHSPLREDNNPSFSFFYIGNNILYKDFSTGESGNLWTFLKKLTNKTIEELCEEILNKNINKSIVHTPIKPKIEVCVRGFKTHDLKYWDSYGISEQTLKLGNIYPIKNVVLNRGGIKTCYPVDKFAYVFVEFENNEQVLKVYQPYSNIKWLSNFTFNIVDLYSILPKKGENVIITSSRKDALTLIENCSIPSICFNSETSTPNFLVIKDLLTRFKNVWVLYDNDYDKPINIGDRSAKALISLFNNIKQLTIPIEYKAKDPSDLVLKHNRTILKQLITKQIYDYQV